MDGGEIKVPAVHRVDLSPADKELLADGANDLN
jgi:hypothetical protein